jgi:hypothetical protein
MARICLLHRVDGQHADGVDRQLIDIALTCHSSASLRPKSVEGGISFGYLVQTVKHGAREERAITAKL